MSMPSLATATRPSYIFRPAGSGPSSGQTVLATWVSAEVFEQSLRMFVFKFLVFIVVIIYFFNDYFTSFYVKHFELPLCMKCAI